MILLQCPPCPPGPGPGTPLIGLGGTFGLDLNDWSSRWTEAVAVMGPEDAEEGSIGVLPKTHQLSAINIFLTA